MSTGPRLGPLRVACGADAAGFELKAAIIGHLQGLGQDVRDYGTYDRDVVDYPDYAARVCAAVVDGQVDLGILVCGTGIGMSIAANKFNGVRAALCHDTFGARMSRNHNNANVLALGAWDVTVERAPEIVEVWLASGYDGGRHEPRLEKIANLEARMSKPSLR